MDARFTVDVSLTRQSGKFATREEVIEEVQAWIELADGGSVMCGPDGDSDYAVDAWDVSEVPDPPRGSRSVLLTKAERELIMLYLPGAISNGNAVAPGLLEKVK